MRGDIDGRGEFAVREAEISIGASEALRAFENAVRRRHLIDFSAGVGSNGRSGRQAGQS